MGKLIGAQYVIVFLDQQKGHGMTCQVLLSQVKKRTSYLEGGEIQGKRHHMSGPIYGTVSDDVSPCCLYEMMNCSSRGVRGKVGAKAMS